MFAEWNNVRTLGQVLLPADQFVPFPKAQDREAWEALSGEKKKRGIKEAEQYLGLQWPELSAALFMEFAQNGNRTNYELPYFHRRRALRALVLGECIEGKGRFLPDIINGIWAICEETFWGIPAHNGASKQFTDSLPDVENQYIDLFVAETGELLSWTNYLLGESLFQYSHRISRRITVELERRIKKPFLEHEDFWWMGLRGEVLNNWTPWIVSNIIGIFLLQESDALRRSQAIEKSMVLLELFLDGYGEDGGCDEGTSYWDKAGAALFDALDLLYLASSETIDCFENPLIKEIGRFIMYSHIAGDYFINFADGAARIEMDRGLVYRYGKRINDENLVNLALGVPYFAAGDRVPQSMQRSLSDLFFTPTLGERSLTPPYLKDVWLKDIQVMAAREIEASEEGLFLAAKGGHNDENHNHNDIGSCIVFLDGQPGLIDVGVGDYTQKTFSPDRYSIWTMQSQYHNLPTINHTQQAPGKNFMATGVNYHTSKEAAEFSLDLHTAYPAEAQVESYRRTYRLEREEGKIVLRDTVQFANENPQIAFHFMCWAAPECTADGMVRIPVGEKTLVIAYPKNQMHCTVEHLETPDERFVPVWGEKGVHRITLTMNAPPRLCEVSFAIFSQERK